MTDRSSKDYVPSADATSNIQERDVVGNKTDAAAAGAVSATESLMAYAKQNVTNSEAILLDTDTTIPATITTLDGYHDVPTKDTADNNQMRDVLGNKTDSISGNSVMSNIAANWGGSVSTTNTLDGNGAQNDNLFTFTGFIEILNIVLVPTNVTDATTVTTCYFDAWDGANSVDITAAGGTDLAGVTPGSLALKNGDNTVALSLNTSAQVRAINDARAGLTLVAKGGATNYIRFNFTGDANTDVDTMVIVVYRALSADGGVTAV